MQRKYWFLKKLIVEVRVPETNCMYVFAQDWPIAKWPLIDMIDSDKETAMGEAPEGKRYLLLTAAKG